MSDIHYPSQSFLSDSVVPAATLSYPYTRHIATKSAGPILYAMGFESPLDRFDGYGFSTVILLGDHE